MKVARPRCPRACSVLLLLVAVLAGACTQENPESLIQSAKEYIVKKNYSAAAIQLKNALQQQENGEARFLLATTLIELGDVGTAELHLRRALDARFAPDIVCLV